MAIGVNVLDRPIEDVSHIRATIKGMAQTFRHLFEPTRQDEAILNGDYVLVEKSRTAHNGDIVVALVDTTDATLKRFYREGDNIRLQPSNAAMKPIIVPASTVEVQGRVIGVLRKY